MSRSPTTANSDARRIDIVQFTCFAHLDVNLALCLSSHVLQIAQHRARTGRSDLAHAPIKTRRKDNKNRPTSRRIQPLARRASLRQGLPRGALRLGSIQPTNRCSVPLKIMIAKKTKQNTNQHRHESIKHPGFIQLTVQEEYTDLHRKKNRCPSYERIG